MKTKLEGKAFVYGANIDTDQIYPGRYLEITEPSEVALHAMEGVDKNFVKEIKEGDIIIASTNFGCGSSREHAAITLKEAGVGAVIADSFGRIFFRNGINLGLPLMVCPKISEMVKAGDTLSVNLLTGEIINNSSEQKAWAQPFSQYVLEILEHGGIKSLIKEQLK